MCVDRPASRAVIASLATALMLMGIATAPADARSRPGSSYGWQGGVNPELALANPYSGIYGLRYTYDRAHYRFDACPGPNQAIAFYGRCRERQ